MRAELLQSFSKTVEHIYAAAVEPEAWPIAVAKIAEGQGADSAALLTPTTPTGEGGYIVPYKLSEQLLQEWATTYFKVDPWAAAALRLGLVQSGRAFVGDELVPDTELLESVFYREFLSRYNQRWFCTGVVFDGAIANLPLTTCSLFRGSKDAPFTSENVELHCLVLRHLSSALGTMSKLRDERFKAAKSVQALDRLPSALALVGRRGNVVFANRAAHKLFVKNDGLTLRKGHPVADGEGWLRVHHSKQRQLEDALKRTLQMNVLTSPSFMDAVTLPRPSGLANILLRTAPLAPSAEFASDTGAAALVFMTDPQEVPVLNVSVLGSLYGVTAAEARVAQELLRGETAAVIAGHLRISESTVKSHLKSLFVKTETTRQTQLIRLLIGVQQVSDPTLTGCP